MMTQGEAAITTGTVRKQTGSLLMGQKSGSYEDHGTLYTCFMCVRLQTTWVKHILFI